MTQNSENNVVNLEEKKAEKKAKEGYQIITLSKLARSLLLETLNSFSQKLPLNLTRQSVEFDKEISQGIEDFVLPMNKKIVAKNKEGEEIEQMVYVGDVELQEYIKENLTVDPVQAEIHKKYFEFLKKEFSNPEFKTASVAKLLYCEIQDAFGVE